MVRSTRAMPWEDQGMISCDAIPRAVARLQLPLPFGRPSLESDLDSSRLLGAM